MAKGVHQASGGDRDATGSRMSPASSIVETDQDYSPNNDRVPQRSLLDQKRDFDYFSKRAQNRNANRSPRDANNSDLSPCRSSYTNNGASGHILVSDNGDPPKRKNKKPVDSKIKVVDQLDQRKKHGGDD